MLVDEDGDGFLELRDTWGNSIAYVLRSRHGSIPEDDFLPEHPNPFFASPGEDGRWGAARTESGLGGGTAWENYKQTEDYAFSRDNLYSFDIDRTSEAAGN